MGGPFFLGVKDDPVVQGHDSMRQQCGYYYTALPLGLDSSKPIFTRLPAFLKKRGWGGTQFLGARPDPHKDLNIVKETTDERVKFLAKAITLTDYRLQKHGGSLLSC